MKSISDRLKFLRKDLGLNQNDFGKKINLSRSHVASLENEIRKLTDRTISDICREFGVSEIWLRTGKGCVYSDNFKISLDDYAKKNNLSEIDISILKAYMDIPERIRKDIICVLEQVLEKHKDKEDRSSEIDKALEQYRLELEAEQKGETFEASRDSEESDKGGDTA